MTTTTPTAQEILNARTLARLSRGEFAALVGVSIATVFRWERGTASPRGAAMRSLRSALAMLAKNAYTDACISAAIAENR